MTKPRHQKTIGIVSKTIHWLLAFLMIFLLVLGWYMVQLDYFSPYYFSAPILHYSLGIIVFFLMLYKTIWQVIKPLPDYDSQHKKIEIYTAKFVHIILLASMIFMPISGYIVVTSGTNDASFFGLFPLPTLFVISKQLRDFATYFHTYFVFVLAAFIGLHILAALKHKFIDKLKTTRNMWPR